MNLDFLLFPFAGGNKYSYQRFIQNKPNFCVIEYPGRGGRMSESLLSEVDLVVENIIVQIENMIKNDYVIYGHSMGALVGYLLCHKIQELGLPKPIKLVVSGIKAPSIKRGKLISHLPDDLFWEEVIKIGGISDELQNYPELVEFYIPILKADFTVVENYEYVKKEKLTIPIDVFYGSEEAEEEEMQGWKDETTANVNITQMEGNHFFIFDHIDFFINYFKNLTNNLIYQQTNA